MYMVISLDPQVAIITYFIEQQLVDISDKLISKINNNTKKLF